MEYKLYLTFEITDPDELDVEFDTYYERQLAAVDDSVDYAIAHLNQIRL